MSEFKQNAQYQWQPEDKFTITGEEFNILYNRLMAFMATPLSPASFVAAADAAAVAQIVLQRGIAEGVAKEVVPETSGDTPQDTQTTEA